MIRIVDILKKYGEWEEPEEGKKAKKEKSKEEPVKISISSAVAIKNPALPEPRKEVPPPPVQVKKEIAPPPPPPPAPIIKEKVVEPIPKIVIKEVYAELIKFLREIISKRPAQLSTQCSVIKICLEKIVQEQISGRAKTLIDDSSYGEFSQALRISFNAVKLGLDTRMGQMQLIELSAAALLKGIEMKYSPEQRPEIRAFRKALGNILKLDSEAYDRFIDLVLIYEEQRK